MISCVAASVGLMFILKYGTILNRYRSIVGKIHPKLEELHKCSLCLGFWTGVVILAIEYNIAVDFEHRLFYLPLISSGCCWVIDNLNNVLQSVELKIDRELDI